MKINSKNECNIALQKGLLGNTVRTWRTKEELRNSGYQGFLGIRDLKPGGLFESPRTVQEALDSTRSGIYFSEYVPIENIVIQGELYQSEHYLTWFYTHRKEQMRFALQHFEDTNHAYGLAALCLLKYYCSPASFDDIQELLELYCGHIIELTVLNREFGSCPGRN